jgi:hypothetical protein
LIRGPPPQAIHGLGRLTRRPAGLPTAQYLRSAIVVNGAFEIKIKNQRQSKIKGQSKAKRVLRAS